VHLRTATADDAVAIATVHVRTWQSAYRGLIPDGYLETLSVEGRSEIWNRILAGTDLPRSGAFVVEDDDAVIGFVHVAPTRDADVPVTTGELTSIYVLPCAWGRGGGRLLMSAALTSMKAAGFTTAMLWVLENNLRARAFYDRQRWTADGTHKIDDRGDFVLLEMRYRTTI